MVETLVLSGRDVRELLDLDGGIAAVERAFRLHADGRSLAPGVLAVPTPNGGFHIKAAGLELDRLYFAAKTNGNFRSNPERHRLPTIQGILVLCDGDDGRPLAVMDSIAITVARTAAASAVAAKYLARNDSRVATICGCGEQGRAHLRALARVLPLERAHAFDLDRERARDFSGEMSSELSIGVRPVDALEAATLASDVIVTATPSHVPFLSHSQVRAGTFLAAVGADSPEKRELHPDLVAAARIVVDVLESCAVMGELHHALDAGLVTRQDVHAELAELVVGAKPGRSSASEITLFDSTGTAIEDVAAAALVYERALETGTGLTVAFGA